MAQKIVAFVARSFDRADEAKIDPIIKFLDSFNKLGFITQSAEQSEVESVSVKVRSLIDKSEVFVGIFTKRHPVYRLQGRFVTALAALRGKLSPSAWSAPPWVLQESGYALKGNKALILFREADVEIPALQGDLEYIPYDPRNPALAFRRASEMISGLIAKVASIRVETVVQSALTEARESDTAVAPLRPSDGEASPDVTASGEETLKMHIVDMFKAVGSRNWESSQREYDVGLKWIREHEPEKELFWDCLYQRTLFGEGQADALDKIRDLAAKNKDKHLPLSSLAACLVDLREYDQAVKCYQEAALIAGPDRRASLEIEAAEVLSKAEKPGLAKEILLRLRDSDYAREPKRQFRILQNLYSLSKESEDKFASFAIGELALHLRPEEMNFRFSLAFDYDEAEQSHLAVHHYKILCDNDQNHASGFHNLAVASAKCDLVVLAARRYKRAYELGETLAASNLGRKYLEAGLSDDAITLLKDAQTKENCVPEVSRMLAAVHEKIEEEDRGQEKVLKRAEEHRNFLIDFANGLLSRDPANLDGQWRFPFGTIDLRSTGSSLQGFKETRAPVAPGGLTALFSGAAPKNVTRIERFEFSAVVSGHTCKFKVENSKAEDPSGWTLLGSPSSSTVEGYILFAEDGRSGQVAQIKDGKPEKYYKVTKLT
jgi:predicted Zn-dependent protease